VVVDGYAAPSPSSRDAFRWGAARDGARSRCDLILDLSGGPPLFPLAELRQGYLRADPADRPRWSARCSTPPAGGRVRQAALRAFDAGSAPTAATAAPAAPAAWTSAPPAPSRPARTAWRSRRDLRRLRRLLRGLPDRRRHLRPAPPASTAARLRALLLGFSEAGGRDPLVLLHDGTHGEALLHALARHSDGLPARVLPLRVNEVSQLDLGALSAALAWGAAGVRLLLPARRPHGAEGVFRNLDYLEAALSGLGLAAAEPALPPRAAAIETDDPFSLAEALAPALALRAGWAPASFLPLGEPREVAFSALRALRDAAGPAAPPAVPMPKLAPFGLARVETAGCTLCLACTTSAPPARSAPTRTRRSCASWRTPACSAASAPPPARSG
jgi:hypothetical protein